MGKVSIPRRVSLGVIGLVVISMIIGSLFDYQISIELFNKNSAFGLFLAAYGQLPAALAMSSAGFLYLVVLIKERSIPNIIRGVLGLLFIAFGIFMAYIEPADYLPNIHKIIHLVLSVLLNISMALLVYKISGKYGIREMNRMALFLVVFVIAQILVINVIKVPWGRPRMRFIAEYSEVAFAPWWKIGSDIKDAYITQGVGSNEFKSFPSGHTASALNILFICAFARYSTFFKKNTTAIHIACLVFGVLVALSRIILGAHFLTDVTVGFITTFLIYLVCVKLILSKPLEAL